MDYNPFTALSAIQVRLALALTDENGHANGSIILASICLLYLQNISGLSDLKSKTWSPPSPAFVQTRS